MKIIRRVVFGLLGALALSLAVVLFTQRKDTGDVILIRVGHDQPITNERHMAIEYFKEIVERETGGRIQIEIFPNGLLGNEAILTESVSFNDLEMVATSSTNQYDSLISVFELPYLFDTHQEAWDTLDGPVGRKVADQYLKYNLRILAFYENGFRHITSNREIHTPEDLRGLKIRTPEFPMSIQTFNALGANATPMSFSELYTALQQGTVDAQENPVANAYTNRFDEVQKYLVNTGHQHMSVHLIISEEFFQSLSPEDQSIILEAAQAGAEYHRKILGEHEQGMIDSMVANGMEVIEVDKELFRAKVKPVYEWFASLHGEEIIHEIQELTK